MMSNVEKQKAFRERMAENGYARKQVWVLASDLTGKKMTAQIFRKKLAELGAGFRGAPSEKRNKLLTETLAIVKAKKEEYEK
jgi:hypothetical protein